MPYHRKPQRKRVCAGPGCEVLFRPRDSRQRYHTDACRSAARRTPYDPVATAAQRDYWKQKQRESRARKGIKS